MKIYDRDRAVEDEDGVFVNYCNRQYRPNGEAFSIFSYIAGMKPEIIENVFQALDMRKVKFAGMSVVRKTKVVKQFQLSLQLNEPKEIVKVIVVVMAGIRENFYEQLKQYMRSR